MKETYVTVSGVVASDLRAVMVDGSLPVTSFRLASTSRRWDPQSRTWVDGHTTWVTITCWRQLALNVNASVVMKDRIVVHGKLRTPMWTGDQGARRSGVEIEAESVGHDLMFGTSSFQRVRKVEPLDSPGRRAADELARAVELDSMDADLNALLAPPDDDELDESEFQEEAVGEGCAPDTAAQELEAAIR